MQRKVGAALMALLTLPMGGLVALAAVPGGVPGPGLAAVGPVSANDGFPVWYKDKNGLRLERCISQSDPLCPARGPLPDETAPVSFPDNYPDEGFYSTASAALTTANGGKGLVEVDLEGAFRSGPVVVDDQITFARVRIKFTNVKDGVDYKITSPVGTKTVRTNGKVAGLIFDTEDIGVGSPGDFTGALGGRIGPFLTWDTFGSKTDPALKGDTYIGDGITPHKVTGSPVGTNLARVEGPGINPSATTDACPTVAGPIADCVETSLFTVQGKVATTAGVMPETAIFSRTSASGGNLDVYASSEAANAQSIQVADASPGAAAAFAPTAMVGDAGHYFARIAYTGAPPTLLRVTNSGDVPASVKTIAVADQVSGTALYDTGKGTLTVNASSSDTAANPALTAASCGALTSGTCTASLLAPPPTVSVTSTAGGTVSLPVLITGPGRAPIQVVAQAGPDQVVQPGQQVTLDASASSGNVSGFAWTSADAIALTGADTARATFTAPTTPGDYLFTVTVSGPGGPVSATATVTVLPAPLAVVADAGPAQDGVRRGTTVTLDGSASTGAASYLWTQVKSPADPTVVLSGATTAHPTFTFPLYKAPATNGALHFTLQVAGTNGVVTAPVGVDITPSADTVLVSTARYSSGKWRVDGTSSVLAGQTVTAHLQSLNGAVIGTSLVDAAGAFSVRPSSGPLPAAGAVVVVESPLGGVSTPFTVRIG